VISWYRPRSSPTTVIRATIHAWQWFVNPLIIMFKRDFNLTARIDRIPIARWTRWIRILYACNNINEIYIRSGQHFSQKTICTCKLNIHSLQWYKARARTVRRTLSCSTRVYMSYCSLYNLWAADTNQIQTTSKYFHLFPVSISMSILKLGIYTTNLMMNSMNLLVRKRASQCTQAW
jgi:hypothetical protein